MRLAVVGLGGIGRHYATEVIPKLPEAEVACVCDVREDVARGVARRLKCEYTTDYSAAITSGDVDAVVLATPPFVRLGPVRVAAEHGKHVFCEKPLASDLATARRILELVRGSGIKLMVGFVLRYWPVYELLKSKLSRGELGKPILLHLTDMSHWVHHVERSPWRALRRLNTGLAEQLVHEVDIARYICGDVAEVFAYGVRGGTTVVDYEDDAVYLLRFESGAIGSIVGSLVCRVRDRSGVLVCDEATVSFDTARQCVRVAYSSGEVVEEELGWAESPYLLELRDFVRWVKGGRAPRATAEDGYKAQEVVEAAYLSMTTGRPVRLPLP